MTDKFNISVFFPAYNEEANIKKTVLEAVCVLKKVANKWEIIVVDDGSKDKTGEIVDKLAEKEKRIKLINHRKNRGYGAALKTGLYTCRHSLICYTDSDGQFNFREVTDFLKKINGVDLVIGYRKKRTDKLYRRILAKILWLADWGLFGLNVKDVDCGFKVLKKEVVERIGKLKTESAITETELVARAKRAGFKIAEVPVEHSVRSKGEQTGGKFKIIFKAAVEGFYLWWILAREKA